MIGKKVVVTTDRRGVFFGTLVSMDGSHVAVLSDARNCFYWSAETKGFLGLAALGPQPGSKVGPPAPSLSLFGVTSVAECSMEARARWEASTWE